MENLKTSKPKLVNSILNIIGVNSLRLGYLHLFSSKCTLHNHENIKREKFQEAKKKGRLFVEKLKGHLNEKMVEHYRKTSELVN